MSSAFSNAQINRYSRHILLKEIGGEGQSRLLNSKVLVIGAGGLGSPLLLYLAAAGIGTIGIIDDDTVDLSNLQRQILHQTQDLDKSKAINGKKVLNKLNPEIQINAYNERITASNALKLMSEYDIVADGSDNFATRFLINDAAFLSKKTLVSAAILQFDGQIATFKAFDKKKNIETKPCYRCIFREPPPPGQIPSCSEAGVLGAFCGVLGSLQATEVIKELLDIGESLSGALLILDGLSAEFRKIKVRSDPDCPLCGVNPKITDLSSHEKPPTT